jgi:hypothetical protein
MHLPTRVDRLRPLRGGVNAGRDLTGASWIGCAVSAAAALSSRNASNESGLFDLQLAQKRNALPQGHFRQICDGHHRQRLNTCYAWNVT